MAGRRSRPAVVAVTGLGAVSPLGWGWRGLWEGVREGRDGITEVKRYPLEGFSVTLGALVPGTNHPMPDEEVRSLCLRYATAAAEEAAREGGLEEAGAPGNRIGLVVGTSLGDTRTRTHELAGELGDRLGVRGPRITVSTACASSANALGLGMELLRLGSADLVLAGGADFLSDSVFAGFHALGVLSAAKCSPFGLPMGTTLGEGAGFLLLECEEYARARGKEPLAYLAGYGLSSDAFHETSPDPKGRGVGRAMASALAAADLGQERVGYVNAHGSGTEANDRSEWLAIQNLFGEKAKRLPVSSTKGHLGHAQGAAGVLEGIVTLLSLREGVVPPTLRCNTRRSFGPDDPVDAPRPRAARYEQSLCVSSAFGGANCVVAFSRPGIHGEPVSNGMHGIDEGREAPRAVDRDAGFVPGIAVRLGAVGLGSVGPFSSFQDSVDRWLGGEEIPPRPLSDLSIQDLAPMADPRDMDNLSRYLVAASTLALKDAGVRVRGSLRDRIGLVVGTDSVSAEEARRFYDSIDKRGLVRCNATSFARMVLNGAAGTCSRILSLRGPTSTVTTGQSSGLLAIVYACQILASQADVDFMIAAGVDAQGLDEELEDGRADGAACLVLGKGGAGEQAHGLGSGVGRADEAPVLVGGWGIAGPGDSARAVAAALEPSGAKLDDVDLVVGDPLPRTLHPAFGSSWVAAAAVRALRTGRARTALVCSDGGRSASCALFLTQAEVDHE